MQVNNNSQAPSDSPKKTYWLRVYANGQAEFPKFVTKTQHLVLHVILLLDSDFTGYIAIVCHIEMADVLGETISLIQIACSQRLGKSKMKTVTSLIRVLLTLVLFSAHVSMAASLAGSAHDFSLAGWNTGGKVCVTCHVPHKSDTTVADAPLWNHKLQTTSYSLYTSPTLKATIGQPGGNSKLCLSCHDGTVAIDSFGGATGTTMISTANNLGNSLKDDHPIGFTYDTALATANGSMFDPSTKTVTIGSSPTKSGTIAALMLFSGKMECSSCHDVHNTFTVGANGSGMVKMASAGSALCVACHNK